MTELRHKDMTYLLRRTIFAVHNQLRAGWPEEAYHHGMACLLRDEGVPIQSKPRRTIVHRGIEVHVFERDLLAWDLIILEFKALPYTTFAPAHYAQLIHYLKCWGKDLGLLVNFRSTRAEIARVVWDEPKLMMKETNLPQATLLTHTERTVLDGLRNAVTTLGQHYGLGYPETMYRNLAQVETNHLGLQCQTNVEIPLSLRKHQFTSRATDLLLINGSCLLLVRALFDHPPQYDFARMKTYLNALRLRLGVIVNFGKHELQLHGVTPD